MPTITKPKITEKLLIQLKTKVEEEKQVIVHCCFVNDGNIGNLIRIWKSTYLIDQFSGFKSEMVYWENISAFPYWTEVPPVKEYWFTLVFTGLPKECTTFNLVEVIPESDGFLVEDIARNETDVYRVKI